MPVLRAKSYRKHVVDSLRLSRMYMRTMASGKPCKDGERTQDDHTSSKACEDVAALQEKPCCALLIRRCLPVDHSWLQAFMLRLAANCELSMACEW